MHEKDIGQMVFCIHLDTKTRIDLKSNKIEKPIFKIILWHQNNNQPLTTCRQNIVTKHTVSSLCR